MISQRAFVKIGHFKGWHAVQHGYLWRDFPTGPCKTVVEFREHPQTQCLVANDAAQGFISEANTFKGLES